MGDIGDSSGRGKDMESDSHQEPAWEHGLGSLVRLARQSRGWSQQDLAKVVNTGKQWVNAVERNEPLSFELALRLFHALVPRAKTSDPSLIHWILRWIETIASTRQRRRGEGGESAPQPNALSESERMAILKLLAEARRLFPKPLPSQAPPLRDFPLAVEPLSVICGDRREVPAHSVGDLFVNTAAMSDVRFLPSLRFGLRDVDVWHDKVVVQMDDSYLRRTFGRRNLLVVGGPSVNLATRVLNTDSLFSFAVPAEAAQWYAEVRELLRPRLFVDEAYERVVAPRMDRTMIQVFESEIRSQGAAARPAGQYQSMSSSDAPPSLQPEVEARVREFARSILRGRSPKEWMDAFRPLAFHDPVMGRVHQLDVDPEKRLDTDYCIVSVCKHPWAEVPGLIAVIAAGIHGPGTSHAVRSLAAGDFFEERPFGGVIEVKLSLTHELPERFIRAGLRWLTDPYDEGALPHWIDGDS